MKSILASHKPLCRLAGNRTLITSAVIAVISLCACSMDDSRDLCCPNDIAMLYTYRPYGSEDFTNNISSLRHFLFSADGTYLKELAPGSNLQRQPIILPEGKYTMITVGNSGESSLMNNDAVPHIASFTLKSVGNASDEIFWGVCSFNIASDGSVTYVSTAQSSRNFSLLTTAMNNIHCHLKVHIDWSNMPEFIGDYEMELSGVPTRYVLDPVIATDAGGFTVPASDQTGTCCLSVPMQSHELDAEFITLRYTDKNIPTLRLRYRGKQVSPDIDLARAFKSWGWYPSRVHIQDYFVHIRLFGDGRAELSYELNSSVSDWIDAGTFG